MRYSTLKEKREKELSSFVQQTFLQYEEYQETGGGVVCASNGTDWEYSGYVVGKCRGRRKEGNDIELEIPSHFITSNRRLFLSLSLSLSLSLLSSLSLSLSLFSSCAFQFARLVELVMPFSLLLLFYLIFLHFSVLMFSIRTYLL